MPQGHTPTMKPLALNEKEKLVIDSDEHYVFCRPKHYVDSSGTTWASEQMELRHTIPIYDVSSNSRHSREFIILCRRLRDDSFYYLETDVEQDFERTGDNEAFTAYERKRVTHLKNRLERGITNYKRVEDKDDLEVKTISDVVRINDVLSDCGSVIRVLSEDK